jgi:hypothetical protein
MNPEASSQMMALLHIFGKPLEVHLGLFYKSTHVSLQVDVCVLGDIGLINRVYHV